MRISRSYSLLFLLLPLAACDESPAAPDPDLSDRVTAESVVSLTLIQANAFSFLESQIEALADAGALNQGQRMALLRKVRNAERLAEGGRTEAAIAQLEAVVEQVEEFVAAGVLTPEQGQLVVAAVEVVRETIGSGSIVIRKSTVAAGSQHTCALDEVGQPWCWGDLGETNPLVPVAVAGAPPLESISAGFSVTCGLDAAGGAWCWGTNLYGTLGVGDPTVQRSATPVPVAAPVPFVDLDVGTLSACGLDATGQAYCWGRNDNGRLGSSLASESCNGGPCQSAPVAAASPLAFEMLDVGLAHACGVATDGVTYCWGWDTFQVDGDGVDGNGGPTPRAVATSVPFSTVTAGAIHSCALDDSGAAYCWGANIFGSVGTGSGVDEPTPAAVAGGHLFRRIESSSANNILTMTCGIDDGDSAWCWGTDLYGELGTDVGVVDCGAFGNIESVPCATEPVPVSGGHAWAELSAGSQFVCGRTTTGDLYCWGRNVAGNLGDGTSTDRDVPTAVAMP